MTQTVHGLLALSDPSLIHAQAFLNGVWVDADSGFDVVNPANGATLETGGSAHALGGLGREGSKYGIDDYPELTCLCVGGI
jgi:acyl-CoA reductase-like NAD-dependent aldehyde dehydrogenase